MQPNQLKLKEYAALWSSSQTEIHAGYFAILLNPQEENICYYFQLGTCIRGLKTHILLSFLWSVFCKWPVIYDTLLTLKIVLY